MNLMATQNRPIQLTRVWKVARELDVSKKRVYQMVREGKLEAVRLGPRSMRITRESLQAFLEKAARHHKEELGLDLPPLGSRR